MECSKPVFNRKKNRFFVISIVQISGRIWTVVSRRLLFARQLTQRKCSHCSQGICYIDHYGQNPTMYFTKCRRRLRSAKFSFYLNRVTDSLFNVSVNLLAYGLNVVFWFKGCEVFVCYTSCSPSWLSISSACPWRCNADVLAKKVLICWAVLHSSGLNCNFPPLSLILFISLATWTGSAFCPPATPWLNFWTRNMLYCVHVSFRFISSLER